MKPTPFAQLGLSKQAAATINGADEETKLKRRRVVNAIKRALSGAAIGGLGGGMLASGEGGMSTGKGMLMGALGGGALGGGIGVAENSIKDYLGMDPLVTTVAEARNT